MMSGLDYERLVLAGGPLGLQQACLDVALPYAIVRTQFGKSIGSFQLIQAKLADMYVALQSSRALVYTTARATDAGVVNSKDCAAAILLAAENATKAGLEAIQVRSIVGAPARILPQYRGSQCRGLFKGSILMSQSCLL